MNMDMEWQPTKEVEELRNFPFKTFQEFRKACLEGIAQPVVLKPVAFDWTLQGIYAPKSLRAQIILFTWLPFLAGLGFLIYAIASHTWLLLLALPVLIVAWFLFQPFTVLLFHPGFAKAFGNIRTGFITLTIIGFIWSVYGSHPALTVLTVSIILIWYGQNAAYNKAVNALIAASTEHEDLLCMLWQGKALKLRFYNGNEYGVDWKLENGAPVFYES